ncbi:integrase, catalytic region, zinc finger, CCHC-type containing protein [Tanacetum coccineum]
MVIKLKWLWKNKKDEDQTVIRNKARLVAKGYAQEEGVDFEEINCTIARMESSSGEYLLPRRGRAEGTHNQGSTIPIIQKKVYLLRKALYRLKQAPRAWTSIHQSPKKECFTIMPKYALEILKKHNMDNCHSIGTPLATKPKLDVDLSGEPVDQSDYRSKIRSLMYLTSSRPDLGLWYQRNLALNYKRTSFSDDDHAGCIDTRKSTFGGIQFLGDKLVSWMSKKQNCTAMSSAEAEYVALSASCAQVMWMRHQLQINMAQHNKITVVLRRSSAP